MRRLAARSGVWHPAQRRLFGLDEAGLLKALRLGEYAALQEALFAYLGAL